MTPHASRSPTQGTAMVIVLGTLLVLSAMALALVLLSITDTMAAANSRRAASALYAADAGIERALPDLWHLPDWNAALDGRVTSGFVDGPSGGSRTLADGRQIVLDEIVHLANCGSAAPCDSARLDTITAERPWGRNNPRWRLFAHGPLSALAGQDGGSLDEYVVVLIADDPAENDDDPLRDGAPGSNPGSGLVLLRAEAFGPEWAHRSLEVTVARGAAPNPSAGYAAQRGQGRDAAGSAGPVQVPGGALTRVEVPSGGR